MPTFNLTAAEEAELERQLLAKGATVTSRVNPTPLAAATTRAVNLPPASPPKSRTGRRPSTASPGRPKGPKYNNRKTERHGFVFDSKKEADRYDQLLSLEAAGVIQNLRRQHNIRIAVNGQTICFYKADFTYVRAGRFVVEDTKSEVTKKIERYRLKKRMMKIILNFDILET